MMNLYYIGLKCFGSFNLIGTGKPDQDPKAQAAWKKTQEAKAAKGAEIRKIMDFLNKKNESSNLSLNKSNVGKVAASLVDKGVHTQEDRRSKDTILNDSHGKNLKNLGSMVKDALSETKSKNQEEHQKSIQKHEANKRVQENIKKNSFNLLDVVRNSIAKGNGSKPNESATSDNNTNTKSNDQKKTDLANQVTDTVTETGANSGNKGNQARRPIGRVHTAKSLANLKQLIKPKNNVENTDTQPNEDPKTQTNDRKKIDLANQVTNTLTETGANSGNKGDQKIPTTTDQSQGSKSENANAQSQDQTGEGQKTPGNDQKLDNLTEKSTDNVKENKTKRAEEFNNFHTYIANTLGQNPKDFSKNLAGKLHKQGYTLNKDGQLVDKDGKLVSKKQLRTLNYKNNIKNPKSVEKIKIDGPINKKSLTEALRKKLGIEDNGGNGETKTPQDFLSKVATNVKNKVVNMGRGKKMALAFLGAMAISKILQGQQIRRYKAENGGSWAQARAAVGGSHMLRNGILAMLGAKYADKAMRGGMLGEEFMTEQDKLNAQREQNIQSVSDQIKDIKDRREYLRRMAKEQQRLREAKMKYN